MNTLDHDTLLEAVGPDSPYASISIESTMQPTGPEGTKVAPPSYPTSANRETPYLIDTRWLGGEKREVVHLDSPQSQANRCEEALRDAIDDGLVSLPMFELVTDVETDEGPRTVRLTSLDFPHRYADAYLRDAEIDGTAFDKTEIGKAFQLAEPRNAAVLYAREPYSLVYGAWNSHRPGRQAKFPRVYDSTIVGLDPEIGMRQGGRLDPNNLTGAIKGDGEDWEYVAAGEKKKGAKLSEIGHGNAMDSGLAHGHTSITEARRLATIHLGGLHGLRFGKDTAAEATTAARAVLVALALLGDRLAFGRPSVFLRSSCELATVSEQLLLQRPAGNDIEFTLNRQEAIDLFETASRQAAAHGIAMDTNVIKMRPKKGLEEAISFAYTKAEGEG